MQIQDQSDASTQPIKYKAGRPRKDEIRPPTNKLPPKTMRTCLTCDRTTSSETQTCSKCEQKVSKYHLKYWHKNQQAHKLEKIIGYVQELDKKHSDQLKQVLQSILQQIEQSEQAQQ